MTASTQIDPKIGSAQSSILLIDECDLETLYKSTLEQSHYHIKQTIYSSAMLLREVEKTEPDIILLSLKSPSRILLETLTTLSQHAPKPVVLLCQQDKPLLVKDILNSGVTSYIAGESSVSRLTNILDVARLRFEQNRILIEELNDTRQQLVERKWVEQAKSLLIENHKMTEREAYNSMRQMAMNNGQKLVDVAKNMISTMKLISNAN